MSVPQHLSINHETVYRYSAPVRLGDHLLRLTPMPGALSDLSHVIETDPAFPNAKFERAMLAFHDGNIRGAVASLQSLLAQHPDHAATLNNLAWFFATVNDSSLYNPYRAVELAERANAVTKHELPGYLDTLAVAYAAAERFDEAVATVERAIRLAESENKPELVPGMRERLAQFQQGKPYSSSSQ